MKIFTAYLCHETNSFSPVPTNLESFRELGIHRPGMDPEAQGNPLKVASAFFGEARRRGDTVVVGLCAHAQPAHPTRRETWDTLRDWLLEDLRQAADGLDMVLIMMHGAMMAEGCDDCEGDMLARIREIVGPDMPVGLLLDLHCNISEAMLRHATVVKACKEYPHTDFDERARELYDLCARTARGEIRPVAGFRRVPMFGLFQTQRAPMRGFIDGLLARERSGELLSVTLGHGFPWADCPDAGASVIAYTDGDAERAEAAALETAKAFYALRETGQARLDGIDACLDRALAAPEGTVVIADMSDNPGGGAGSDSTFILRRLLERGIDKALVAYVWDPVAVDMAFAAGEGATLPLRIGGKVGPGSGDPLDLEVTIEALRTDAEQAHIADGEPTALGRTALVSAGGVQIVLNTIRQQPFSPVGLEECGAAPWDQRIVVVKSSHHFYNQFHQRSAEVLYCDAPGTLQSDISRLPYRHITRPVWPLDELSPEDAFADGPPPATQAGAA